MVSAVSQAVKKRTGKILDEWWGHPSTTRLWKSGA